MLDSSQAYRINKPQVISGNIDGEVVLINLRTGIYYSIDGVGAELWESLDKGASSEDLVSATVQGYSGDRSEIKDALVSFLSRLKNDLLIVETEASGNNSEPESTSPPKGPDLPRFEAPVLEKYSDMKDLLLLDPIHDVDEIGWPAPKGWPVPKEAS